MYHMKNLRLILASVDRYFRWYVLAILFLSFFVGVKIAFVGSLEFIFQIAVALIGTGVGMAFYSLFSSEHFRSSSKAIVASLIFLLFALPVGLLLNASGQDGLCVAGGLILLIPALIAVLPAWFLSRRYARRQNPKVQAGILITILILCVLLYVWPYIFWMIYSVIGRVIHWMAMHNIGG